MRLSFKNDFLSIKRFESVDLPDFTVLIGKNGSGKTHLLKAINEGNAELEGIDKSIVVYYHYTDFLVSTAKTDEPNSNNQKRALNSNNTNAKLKKAVEKAIENSEDELLAKHIYKDLTSKNFDFESLYGNDEDYEDIEKFKNSKLDYTYFISSSGKPSNSLHGLVESVYVPPNNVPPEFDKEWLRRRFEQAKKEAIQIFKSENEDLYEHLSAIATRSKSEIWSMFHRHTGNYDFLLEDIANEEKDYQLKKIQNLLHRISAEELDAEVEYLDREKFVEEYGQSPVDHINKVLKEYDDHGYILTKKDIPIKVGIDKDKLNVDIKLKHTKEGYDTSFDKLSSGEKILVALSLLIYKTQREAVMPRVLLLDEIDASLHPSMIKRLLSVIQERFIGELKMKVILATHSPTTVALANSDSIFKITNYASTKISRIDQQEGVDILSEGFASITFDEAQKGIAYNLGNTTLPVLFTEGITDKMIIETAWKKLYKDVSMEFYVQDCFDAKFLSNLFQRGDDAQDGIFENYGDRALIAMFDFDDTGYYQWKGIKKLNVPFEDDLHKGKAFCNEEGNAYKLLLPVPDSRIKNQVVNSEGEILKKPSFDVELMFYDVPGLERNFKEVQVSGGGYEIEFVGKKKRKFAEKLNDVEDKYFECMIPLFDKIKRIIATYKDKQEKNC